MRYLNCKSIITHSLRRRLVCARPLAVSAVLLRRLLLTNKLGILANGDGKHVFITDVRSLTGFGAAGGALVAWPGGAKVDVDVTAWITTHQHSI